MLEIVATISESEIKRLDGRDVCTSFHSTTEKWSHFNVCFVIFQEQYTARSIK